MEKSQLDNLIVLSRQNDEKAFREIVVLFQQMVYSLSFRLLCDEEEAKDVVQETFLKVWLNLSRYDEKKKFSTWIYTIASNLCVDRLKALRSKRKCESFDKISYSLAATENSDQKIIDLQAVELIRALTDDLTPKQKIVFILNHLEGLEVDEIVEITGMTPAKIKSNLYLARQTMRKFLKKYYSYGK